MKKGIKVKTKNNGMFFIKLNIFNRYLLIHYEVSSDYYINKILDSINK